MTTSSAIENRYRRYIVNLASETGRFRQARQKEQSNKVSNRLTDGNSDDIPFLKGERNTKGRHKEIQGREDS